MVPDLARGLALLGIAIANVATAWLVAGLGTQLDSADYFGGVVDDSLADKFTVFFTAIAAHNRGLPMFSTLLGFGVGLIALSLQRRGFTLRRSRAIVAKRYAYLALFGTLHMVFLFFGDIMFFYGICGVVLAALLDVSDKTLKWLAGVPLAITAVVGTLAAVAVNFTDSNFLTADFGKSEFFAESLVQPQSYLDLVASNALVWVLGIFQLPMTTFLYLPLMLIGFRWARAGVLTDVAAHKKTLLTWATAAVVISVGIGVPWGYAAIHGSAGLDSTGWLLLNSSLGVFTGPGILAALALLAAPLQRRVSAGEPVPGVLTPIIALGKRSMSGYVAQSILFAAVVYPFWGNFPQGTGAATQTLLAIGVWLATVLAAWVLERLGKPGPLEHVHRRLAYGPTMRPEPGPPAPQVPA